MTLYESFFYILLIILLFPFYLMLLRFIDKKYPRN